MDKIYIQKDIPVPQTHSKYPWPDMEIGDSVLMPCTRQEKEEVRFRVVANAHNYGKLKEKKFKVRFYDCDHTTQKSGFRVWRIK